ncbi:MAG: SLAC1 anion channel family protein [Gammaproteobacteria bacterium]|nr:SLAC1 anion channel family protein [Gammaproteobacteria bacterium]
MSDSSRLQYFPISFFAMVMGLSGLTLAWEKAEATFDLSLKLHVVLAFFALAVFLLLASIYTAKFLRFRPMVLEELKHPVKLNFFPAISISLILLATTLLHILPGFSKALWMVGSAMHLSFTLYVMSVWIHHDQFEIHHINPAWFIPVVGNVLVPIAGTAYGFTEISWFFFSIGIVFWIVLMTIIFYRVFFHNPIPAKLMPTFFILIAPPAVGCIAYIRLTGEADAFARILFYTGLYLTLLLATQIRRFAKLQFFLSWWAYTFPLAAMTVATFLMSDMTGGSGLRIIGIVLLIVLTAIVLFLLLRTLKAVRAGKICQPED